eukprot:scaffold83988_cov28-Tisochrysis_lutea.AAC.4
MAEANGPRKGGAWGATCERKASSRPTSWINCCCLSSASVAACATAHGDGQGCEQVGGQAKAYPAAVQASCLQLKSGQLSRRVASPVSPVEAASASSGGRPPCGQPLRQERRARCRA